MGATVTTAAPAPAKQSFVQIAEGDFMKLVGVIETLVENTTLSTTNKQPLSDTLASVKAGVTTTAKTPPPPSTRASAQPAWGLLSSPWPIR
jgi:hypothetical protein